MWALGGLSGHFRVSGLDCFWGKPSPPNPHWYCEGSGSSFEFKVYLVRFLEALAWGARDMGRKSGLAKAGAKDHRNRHLLLVEKLAL